MKMQGSLTSWAYNLAMWTIKKLTDDRKLVWLFNGTSALFRIVVPRAVERKEVKYIEDDLRLLSYKYMNKVNVDTIDKNKE